MTIHLNALTLPEPFVPFLTDFKEVSKTNQSINGTSYTDFFNVIRVWHFYWPQLSRTLYDQILAVYNSQFTDFAYPLLVISEESINTLAKMDINTRDLRFDGDCVREVNIVLTEQAGYIGNS